MLNCVAKVIQYYKEICVSQLEQNSQGIIRSNHLKNGLSFVQYTEEENSAWELLYRHQINNLKNKAILKFLII